MTLIEQRSTGVADELNSNYLPSIEELFDSAMAEHPREFGDRDESELNRIIGQLLYHIDLFEEVARQPVKVTQEVAMNIAAVRIHSGVGTYDEATKDDENIKLSDKEFALVEAR